MTIKEILGQPDGIPIVSIKGTLKVAFTPVEGKGSNQKPYRFENFILKDETGEIKVTLANRDPLDKSLKGKVIYLNSYHGEHGWTGVKTKLDTYKGKSELVLWVTATGEISTEPPAQQETQPMKQEYKVQAPPVADDNPELKPVERKVEHYSAPVSEKTPLDRVKITVARYNTLMMLAEKSNAWGVEQWEQEHDAPMAREHVQARTMSLFIALRDWCEKHDENGQVIDAYRDTTSTRMIDKVPTKI